MDSLDELGVRGERGRGHKFPSEEQPMKRLPLVKYYCNLAAINGGAVPRQGWRFAPATGAPVVLVQLPLT